MDEVLLQRSVEPSADTASGALPQTTQTTRNGYADFVKFVVIFCVVWAHAVQHGTTGYNISANPVFKFIYGFHMPLFALISGWFFFYSANKYTLKEIFKKKCLSMAVAIIGGNFLYWVVWVVTEIIRTGDVTLFVNGGWINQLFNLWFLWAIMLAMAFVGFAYTKVKNKWLAFLAMIVAIPLFFVFPNSVSNIFVYPFFLIGFYACKYKDALKKIAPLRFLSIVLYPLLIAFYGDNYYIDVAGLWGTDYTPFQYMHISSYRFVTGLVGCIFALTLLKGIHNLINDTKICKLFEKVGTKSLQIYVMQAIAFYLEKVVVDDVLSKTGYCEYINSHWQLHSFVFSFVFSIFLMIVIYWLTKLFYKIKIGKFIFGR